MATNAEIMWSFFASNGLTPAGIAGLMGNLYAESGLIPNNMQNSREGTYNDTTYTAAINNKTYSESSFVNDGIGYGIAQWTSSSRKQQLYTYIITNNNGQIDNLQLQL